MKKKALSLIMCVVLIFSFAGGTGCAKQTETDANTDGQANVKQEDTVAVGQDDQQNTEKVTLRLFTRWSEDSPNSVAFRERVAEFMVQNPNITVVDESTNDETNFNDKWKASIATDDMPDVFQNYGGAVNEEYVKNGLFADISSDLDSDKEWKDGFLDFFDNWKYDESSAIYGVPYEFYAVALFYNKDIFEEKNLEAPKTIDEFIAVSDKLLADGIIPMAIGEKDAFKGLHLFSCLSLKKNGVELFPQLGSGAVAWESPEVTSIFNIMSEWNTKGYFGENINGVDYNTEKAMFFDGQTAMHYDGSWFLAEAEASEIKDSIGVVAMPSFVESPENQDTWMGGPGAGLSIAGDLTGAKRDAAIKLLKFLTSVEHFEYIQTAAKGGVYPVKIDADASVIGPVTLEYTALVNTAKEFSLEAGAFLKPEVGTQLSSSIQGLFGGYTPEEVAQEIASVAN